MIYSSVISSTTGGGGGGTTLIVNNVTGVWPVGITNDTDAFTSGGIVFSGSNLTFGTFVNGGTQYIQATAGGAGIAIGDGASNVTDATVVFSDANGISFGIAGSTITGSHNAYSNSSQLTSKFITTAMASDAGSLFQYSSNTSLITADAVNTATLANLQYTSNTSLITSNAVNTSILGNLQYTSGTSVITSLAFPSTNTTKFAGSGFTTTAITGTEVVGTLNSLGLKIAVPAYLTTAATGGGGGAALQGSGTYIQNSGTIQFANSNDITFGLTSNQMTASFSQSTHAHDYVATANSSLFQHTSATSAITANAVNTNVTSQWLTTAALSNHTHSDLYINTSLSGGFQLTSDNSLSLGVGYTTHTHDYQSTGAYLTTAMASESTSVFQYTSNTSNITSNAFPSANTTKFALSGFTTTAVTGTEVKATHDSAGLKLAVPAYITTYAAGGGSIALSAGTLSGDYASLVFSNSNNVSFGLSGSTITANATVAQSVQPVAISATNGSLSFNTLTLGTKNGFTFYTDASGLQGSYTVPTIPGATVFSNSNNVTFGLNGSTVTGSASFVQSAEPRVVSLNGSSGSMSLNVGSSLSASTDGSTIIFGLASNITTVFQTTGAYLTTAMQSASSSVFAKTGITTVSTAGSDLAATHDTNGLSLGIPKWLTIAGGAGDGVNIIAAGGSTAASTGTVVFSNSNGISFGLNGATVTAQHNALTTAAASDHTHSNLYQSTGAYLTTAMVSNAGSNFAGLGETTGTTAGTDIKLTVDSNGVNISFPKWITTAMASENTSLYQSTGAYLTTAAQSGHTHGAGTTASTAGSELLITSASNSWQLGVPKWITTYAAQSAEPRVVSINGTSGSLSFNMGSSLSSSQNGSAFTFGLASNITTALQSTGVYLTTAMASNQSLYSATSQLSATFAQTANVMLTGERANYFYTSNNTFLTTAALSNHTHDYQSTGAYLTTQRDQVVSASNGSYTFETIKFGSSIVTFFTNASGIQGSYSQSTHPHDYLLTANSSLLQHTSATSAITASALNTSVSGSFQLTANNSLSLDTGYTTHTHLYQSTGAYLTTAMVSNASSNFAGIGLSTESTSGSGLAITYNTSGLSLGIPAWITTGGAGGGVAIAASGSTETDSTVIFSNSNGVSFGLSDYTMTAQIAGVGSVNFSDGSGISWGSSVNGVSSTITGSIQQSYVLSGNNSNTTAFTAGSALTLIASDNVTIGANSDNQIYIKAGGGGDKQWTVASTNAGTDLSVSTGAATNTIYYPAWLTTYTPGAGGGEWSVVTTNAGTDIIISTATNTNTLYHPAFITTAAASNHTHSDLYIAKGDSTYYQSSNLSSVFQTTGAYLTTAAQSVHTHDYQSTGAYLTTAMVSNAGSNFVGLNSSFTTTNGTDFLWSINSSGATIHIPKYITTYVAGAGAAVAAAGATISDGTALFSNSNGVSFGGNGSTITAQIAGVGTVYYSDGSGVSWGSSVDGASTTITASVNAGAGGVAVIASDATYTSGSVSFRGTNITIGTSAGGQFIDLSVGAGGGVGTGTTITGNASITLGTAGMSFNGSGLAGTTTAVTGRASITLNSSGLQFNGSGLAGTNTAVTNCAITVNSSGVSVFGTVGSGTTLGTTAGTAMAVTLNTAGINITYPAVGYLSLVNSNGYSWSTSSNGISTAIWLVLQHTA